MRYISYSAFLLIFYSTSPMQSFSEYDAILKKILELTVDLHFPTDSTVLLNEALQEKDPNKHLQKIEKFLRSLRDTKDVEEKKLLLKAKL